MNSSAFLSPALQGRVAVEWPPEQGQILEVVRLANHCQPILQLPDCTPHPAGCGGGVGYSAFLTA